MGWGEFREMHKKNQGGGRWISVLKSCFVFVFLLFFECLPEASIGSCAINQLKG